MPQIIIANITWNKDGWRNIYLNPKAGASYARKYPGHECLNFNFDKEMDQGGVVHGYVQWTSPPAQKFDGGVILFYSKNLVTNIGEIVGIYGGAQILREPQVHECQGLENDELLSNILADEKLSMLFPIPLPDRKFKALMRVSRLVPQTGFRYLANPAIAEQILKDEILALDRSGMRISDQRKLIAIYEYVLGMPYQSAIKDQDKDLLEQENIVAHLHESAEDQIDSIIQDLKNLKPGNPETIAIAGKTYRRDNKTIAQLKILRGFQCQICKGNIKKRDGSAYIEAAHIKPKSEKGLEMPQNILILCPNHHKEFDLGDKAIIAQDEDQIVFRLNKKKYTISLKLEATP